jgi:hypothetical protein
VQWLPLVAASVHPLAATGGSGAGDATAMVLQLASTGLNLGLAGLVIFWFFSGKLHSDDEITAVRKDLETTQAALERTRDALMLSSARNETGTLSAEIIAQALGFSRRDRRSEDDDRRQERRAEDDDRRTFRRDQDDERRGTRAAEDVGGLRDELNHDRSQREGPHVRPEEA